MKLSKKEKERESSMKTMLVKEILLRLMLPELVKAFINFSFFNIFCLEDLKSTRKLKELPIYIRNIYNITTSFAYL